MAEGRYRKTIMHCNHTTNAPNTVTTYQHTRLAPLPLPRPPGLSVTAFREYAWNFRLMGPDWLSALYLVNYLATTQSY